MERTARLKYGPEREARLFRRRQIALAGIFAVLWFGLQPFAAHAQGTARLAIGGESVFYTVPDGLASVQGILPLNLKALDKEFFMDTKVFGIYVPKTYLDARKQNPEALPEYYLQLCHDAFFTAHSFDNTAFYVLGVVVKSILARQYAKASFREKLAAVFSGAMGLAVHIDALTYLGSIEQTPSRFSVMGTGRALVTASGREQAWPFAVVTTLHMVGGKVITTIQIRRTPQRKDVEAFRQEALATVQSVWGVQ